MTTASILASLLLMAMGHAWEQQRFILYSLAVLEEC